MEALIKHVTDEVFPYFVGKTRWSKDILHKFIVNAARENLLYIDADTRTVCFGRKVNDDTVEVTFLKGKKEGFKKLLIAFKKNNPTVKQLIYFRHKKSRNYTLPL